MSTRGKKEVILIAHNVRSLYNVGSIFRTCDGAGVTNLVLSGYTGFPPRGKISKVALGAEKSVPFEKIKHIGKHLIYLKKKGFEIVALETNPKSRNIYKLKPKFPLALIIGNEKKGLSKAILNKADKCIFIPMKGKKKSLNVAVAAAVALYKIIN